MTDTLQDLAQQLPSVRKGSRLAAVPFTEEPGVGAHREAGELLEHFQWMTDEQSRDLPPEKRDAVAAEAADVLLYLIQLTSALGIDPVAAAQGKLKLNELKYPVDRRAAAARSTTNSEHGAKVIVYQASKSQSFITPCAKTSKTSCRASFAA